MDIKLIKKIVKESKLIENLDPNENLDEIDKYLGFDYLLIEKLYEYNLEDFDLKDLIDEFKEYGFEYKLLKEFHKNEYNIEN